MHSDNERPPSVDDVSILIRAGRFDDHLEALARVLEDRRREVVIDAARAFQPGDRVTITTVSPKYMQGAKATLSRVNTSTATVILAEARRRFRAGQEVKVPLSSLKAG